MGTKKSKFSKKQIMGMFTLRADGVFDGEISFSLAEIARVYNTTATTIKKYLDDEDYQKMYAKGIEKLTNIISK